MNLIEFMFHHATRESRMVFYLDIISLIIYSIYLRKCYLSVYMNRIARDEWYDFLIIMDLRFGSNYFKFKKFNRKTKPSFLHFR